MDYSGLYNQDYYAAYAMGDRVVSYRQSGQLREFMACVADHIVKNLHPVTVLDVGCAMGFLVAALRGRGVQAFGIDVSEYAVSQVRDDIKSYCRVCSALDSLPEDFPKTFDLVTNIEVAEHLYEEDGRQLIRNLCSCSDHVLFSSTSDDFKEKTHFNVQQPEYWAKQFAVAGFLKDLTYDASYISPDAFLFSKNLKSPIRLVEDYERTVRLSKNIITEREKEIVRLSGILTKKEEQVSNLQKASDEKDQELFKKEEELLSLNQYKNGKKTVIESLKQFWNSDLDLEDSIEEGEKAPFKMLQKCIFQLERQLGEYSDENNQLQETLNEREERIHSFIQANQLLQNEVAKWEASYQSITGSACWKITKPVRMILDALKSLFRHLVHNRLTHYGKKFLVSVRIVGWKNTFRKAGGKFFGRASSLAVQSCAQTEAGEDGRQVNFLLDRHLRDIQPIQTVLVKNGPLRLNFVTDSMDSHSLLGGVATALIVASEFATRNHMELRIITRTTPQNPQNYRNIMQVSEVPPAENVTFYSDSERDVAGNIGYKLEISENDVFFATSWWSAAAIRKTTLRERFFYIIQEVETFFYPHGDQHYLCTQVMQDEKIDFIVNSHYLFDYFQNHEPNIARHGVYFEPAFPASLYQAGIFAPKKKYKLFFYARPNNPRNMFYYGIYLLEKSMESGILDMNEWDIYCAGQDIPPLEFFNGYRAKNLGRMDWQQYGDFLKGIDLSLSLMYTPHPSYPPYDVASSGGVVISNRCANKQTFDWCKNVIFSDLDEKSFLNSMEDAVRLAKDTPRREKNFKESTIPRNWKTTLQSTLSSMEEMLKNG